MLHNVKVHRLILVNLLLSSLNVYADPTIPKDSVKKTAQETKMIESFSLDAQFNGPFKDTLIQRWVDNAKGNVCYLYIPVVLPERQLFVSPNDSDGKKQNRIPPKFKIYGPNNLGSISCVKG